MRIRSKKDISSLLDTFSTWSSYDEIGKKHYFVFTDEKRGGDWTLMRYSDGLFTLHGKGDDYCDEGEKVLHRDELVTFIWNNRKRFNEKTLV